MLDAIREYGITTLFTAPTAYRAMLGAEVPDSLHTCVSAGEPLPAERGRGVAREDRHPHHRRDRLDRDAAHLHRLAGRRGAARLVRAAGAGLRGADRRRRHEDAAAGRGGPAGRARADRLPLPRRPAPGDLRARRLEPDRRRVLDGRRRLLLVPGPHRRHDHLLGLQHLGLRGRGRAARAPGGRRVRGRGRAGRAARARGDGLRRDVGDRSSAGELQDHVKASIAPYKYPRRIEFVDALPRTPTGKVQRNVLREQAS